MDKKVPCAVFIRTEPPGDYSYYCGACGRLVGPRGHTEKNECSASERKEAHEDKSQ